MKAIAGLGLALALAGCGAGRAPPPTRAAPVPVPGTVAAPVSLEGVRGQSGARLIAAFGPPRIDLREGRGRKLQFLGAGCVLDAYLYPQANGGEPVVAHLDARLRNGNPTDPASCVATLQRSGAP